MSEFKFTPGPWRVGEKMGVFTNIVHDGSGVGMCPHVMAKVTTRYSSIEQAAANANLIAAAPEMLALLEWLIDIEGPQPGHAEWATKVQCVISKALGQ